MGRDLLELGRDVDEGAELPVEVVLVGRRDCGKQARGVGICGQRQFKKERERERRRGSSAQCGR